MSVAVIVPWRGGCEHREKAWAWVRARYAEQHPDWELIVGEAPDGPWVKALAIMPAIERGDAEIVVVGDADVWHADLSAAVEAVESGAPWAVPHRGVFRLTEASTGRLLDGEENWEGLDLAQPPYLGVEGGGFVIAPRQTLLDIPLDPRFVGWGQEDESHALALRVLMGPRWRGRGPLAHLWHPPQERLNRRQGSEASWQLRRRYLRAQHNPEAMRRLIEEIHDACPTAESSVLGNAAIGVG